MVYQLLLRSRGGVVHRQIFEAGDDPTAKAVGGAVFHSTKEHWDSYDVWDGARLIGGHVAEQRDRLADNIEEIAVMVEEAIQSFGKFRSDEKLAARIKELRERHPR